MSIPTSTKPCILDSWIISLASLSGMYTEYHLCMIYICTYLSHFFMSSFLSCKLSFHLLLHGLSAFLSISIYIYIYIYVEISMHGFLVDVKSNLPTNIQWIGKLSKVAVWGWAFILCFRSEADLVKEKEASLLVLNLHKRLKALNLTAVHGEPTHTSHQLSDFAGCILGFQARPGNFTFLFRIHSSIHWLGLLDPCLAQCPTWQHYEPYEMLANHPTIEPSGWRGKAWWQNFQHQPLFAATKQSFPRFELKKSSFFCRTSESLSSVPALGNGLWVKGFISSKTKIVWIKKNYHHILFQIPVHSDDRGNMEALETKRHWL